MEILRGYVLRHNLQRLLQPYWYEQVVVPKAGKFLERVLVMERGVTQGYLLSLTIFDIVVDAVAMEILLKVFSMKYSHHSMGWSAG